MGRKAVNLKPVEFPRYTRDQKACTKIKTAQCEEIIKKHKEGRTINSLHIEYNVHWRTIKAIVDPIWYREQQQKYAHIVEAWRRAHKDRIRAQHASRIQRKKKLLPEFIAYRRHKHLMNRRRNQEKRGVFI